MLSSTLVDERSASVMIQNFVESAAWYTEKIRSPCRSADSLAAASSPHTSPQSP
jgi:hypothetical protein